jgi:hypothetical protein
MGRSLFNTHMKPDFCDITILLDRSGSMGAIATDVIGGFNRFLADQKAAPGRANLTLHQFDDMFETPQPTMDIQKAAPLTHATFVPRGSTALLDAISKAVKETGLRLSTIPEADRPGKVVFAIVTDGAENSSIHTTLPQVHEMIKHQREKYSWQFVFLAANQDAMAVGGNMGIARANAMTFAATSAGVASSYNAFTSNVSAYRCGSKADLSWEDDQKKIQADLNAQP